MKIRLAFILLFIILVPTWQSCDQSGSSPREQGTEDKSNTTELLVSAPATDPLSEAPVIVPIRLNQKIIYQASLEFEVGDYEKSSHTIKSLVQTNNGYIEKGNENRHQSTLANTLTIRVPAQNLNALLEALLRESVYLVEKNLSGKDVSVEVVDVNARLKSKKAVESRYQELLRKANSIKEIMEVEERLSFLREDIEVTEGRLHHLQSQIAYSTVTLRYYQQMPSGASPSDSYMSRLAIGFATGWEMLGSFLVGLVYMWPFLMLLFVVAVSYRYKQTFKEGGSVKGR